MGNPSGERVQARADVNPISEFPTKTSENQGPPLNGGGDTEAHGQGCSEESHLLCESIHQPDLFGPQERWLSKASDQLETSESVYSPTTFQDGESGNDQRPAERRQLDGFNRPKGCLPVGHNMARSSEVSEIPMAGQSVRVSVPSLWSEQCTTCLHQTTETCTCKASPPGYQTDNVLRRYVGDGTEQGGTRESLIPDNISFRVVRFCGQQGEVSAQVIHYLGFMVDSKEMKIRLSEHKATQILTACKKIREKGSTSVRELAKLIGKMTATLPAIFPAPLWYRELQRLKNQTYQRSQSFETTMTLNQEALLELDWWSIRRGWEECINTGTRPHHGDRCFITGLGSSLPGHTNRGTLVSDGTEEPHQLSGTSRSLVRSESTCQRQEEHSYPSEDGQPDSSVLCELNGGTRSPVLSSLAIQLWQ